MNTCKCLFFRSCYYSTRGRVGKQGQQRQGTSENLPDPQEDCSFKTPARLGEHKTRCTLGVIPQWLRSGLTVTRVQPNIEWRCNADNRPVQCPEHNQGVGLFQHHKNHSARLVKLQAEDEVMCFCFHCRMFPKTRLVGRAAPCCYLFQ